MFTRVWKPLCRIRVLKTLRGSPKREAQKGQYLPVVGFGGYKWYQSQALGDVPVKKWYQSQASGDVPVKRLSPEGGGHEAVCQQGRWVPKGDGL